MVSIYKPVGNRAYNRITVKDPEPYLKDGWYLSIEACEEKNKQKSAKKKSAKKSTGV